MRLFVRSIIELIQLSVNEVKAVRRWTKQQPREE